MNLWLENSLYPIIGSFAKSEPRSIIVMDNDTIHMSLRLVDLIRATGTYLLYTAPYSPYLNPIELGFNVHKSGLRRNYIELEDNCYAAHIPALDSVRCDVCIEEFRRCEVPYSQEILTSDEEKALAVVIATQLS